MLVGAAHRLGLGGAALHALHAVAGDAAADVAQAGWSHYVRFVGAGTIGVAAIWTLAKLVKPVVSGLAARDGRVARAQGAARAASLPRTEHDMPIGIVGLVSLLCLVPIAWLLCHFGVKTGSATHSGRWSIGGVVFVVVMGFLVSAVCGYMAGLIGSSNSPLSGIGILVVVVAALLLVVGVKPFAARQRGQGTGRHSRCSSPDRVRGGLDREQQPAGSEDRPTGRRHAFDAAVGAGDRRAGRARR